MERLHPGDSLLYDITSIPSYSPLDIFEYGHAKDRPELEQVNLGMVMERKRRVPLYFEMYSGSIPDVVTLGRTMEQVKPMITGIEIILDRGFFSLDNLKILCDMRYVIAASMVRRETRFGVPQPLQAEGRHGEGIQIPQDGPGHIPAEEPQGIRDTRNPLRILHIADHTFRAAEGNGIVRTAEEILPREDAPGTGEAPCDGGSGRESQGAGENKDAEGYPGGPGRNFVVVKAGSSGDFLPFKLLFPLLVGAAVIFPCLSRVRMVRRLYPMQANRRIRNGKAIQTQELNSGSSGKL
ncbi:MAG: hypothetical protein M1410_04520 [Candidatus Thermoplasmatota archaeon]|nr:hypothetical protein [Candidatus Thermoplasmatota archaeon]